MSSSSSPWWWVTAADGQPYLVTGWPDSWPKQGEISAWHPKDGKLLDEQRGVALRVAMIVCWRMATPSEVSLL